MPAPAGEQFTTWDVVSQACGEDEIDVGPGGARGLAVDGERL